MDMNGYLVELLAHQHVDGAPVGDLGDREPRHRAQRLLVVERARQLLARARDDAGQDVENPDFTRGPLISQFSFTIDIREWGFSDPRGQLVREARNLEEIREIAAADVWDERGEDRPEPREDSIAV